MRPWVPVLTLQLWSIAACAQRGAGELRIAVRDSHDLAVAAHGTLINEAAAVRIAFDTDASGRYAARSLPFGTYLLRIERQGFAPFSRTLQVRSAVPQEVRAELQFETVKTSVSVTDSSGTLLDRNRTGGVNFVGAELLRDRPSSAPGRGVLDLVRMQPGWLLEANGVLHPRGAEYDTQYVIDGIPLADNRSPAFAPGLEAGDFQSMRILTGGYPAEYGRKLGGIVELDTRLDPRAGLHGRAAFEGGSFGERDGYLSTAYARGPTALGLSFHGGETNRFLDPPVEQNYTNHGSQSGGSVTFSRDLTALDRLRFSFDTRKSGFLVPNELVQHEAGQRQDRGTGENAGTAAYQHVFAPKALLDVHVMVRDLAARLWSNLDATPIEAAQDRGFREGYAGASISADLGRHDFKAGTESVLTSVSERFGYAITESAAFEDVPPAFQFAGRQFGREHSAYIQDLYHAGHWTFSAGLRWDMYRLLVRDSCFSPRLAISWTLPGPGVSLRASYDRAFEIPAIENLLLASSAAAQHLTRDAAGLPVRPSRGNFYQAGFSKLLFGRARLDGTWFRKSIRDFADDDLLLNTGVSFPVAFSAASVSGIEASLESPRWGRFSGFLSYSNLSGRAWLPVTGGLFLDAASTGVLTSRGNFPITQNQRNTAYARVRAEVTKRLWAAFAASFGSGLPLEEIDKASLAQYDPRIVERVNLARGRVRPSSSLDASTGFALWSVKSRSVRLQANVQNITNRLNVINFASLFSGTALGAPRSVAVRLLSEF